MGGGVPGTRACGVEHGVARLFFGAAARFRFLPLPLPFGAMGVMTVDDGGAAVPQRFRKSEVVKQRATAFDPPRRIRRKQRGGPSWNPPSNRSQARRQGSAARTNGVPV